MGLPVSKIEDLRPVFEGPPVLVLDVRDASDIAAGKGGPPSVLKDAVNVPLNISDGVGQEAHTTTRCSFSPSEPSIFPYRPCL